MCNGPILTWARSLPGNGVRVRNSLPLRHWNFGSSWGPARVAFRLAHEGACMVPADRLSLVSTLESRLLRVGGLTLGFVLGQGSLFFALSWLVSKNQLEDVGHIGFGFAILSLVQLG